MQIQAPGKIILSGEHAVVYGEPALALAINQYATLNLQPRLDHFIQCEGLGDCVHYAVAELASLKKTLDARYQAYRSGTLSIHHILEHPAQLIFYTVALFLDHFQKSLNQGLTLTFDMALPIGSGMGASAACICALLTALNDYFATQATCENLHTLAVTAEHLQHGFSSGLDCHLSLYGGLVLFQKTQIQPQPQPALSFYFYNTGKPACTTGECVEHVRQFKNDTALWHTFGELTRAIAQALREKNSAEISLLLRENHQLLCRIGVVPEQQRQFIELLHKEHIAAKLSGAGAVRGDTGGLCLLFSKDDEKIKTVCNAALKIRGVACGAQRL